MKLWTRLATVAGAAVMMVSGVASVALADGQGPGHSAFAPHINTWNGEQVIGWCMDNERATPKDSMDYEKSELTAWNSSWILNHYGAELSDTDTGAAVSYLMHVAPDLPHEDKTPVNFSYATASENAKIEEIRAAAADQAGPYTVNAQITQSADHRAGHLTITLTSAAGTTLTGWTGTAYLNTSGGATFADGSYKASFTSGTPATLDLKATSNAATDAQVTFDMPAGQVNIWTAPGGNPTETGYQRVVAANSSTAEVRGSATADHPFVVDFQPTVSTTTSSARANVGDDLSDHLIVGVADGKTWTAGVAVPIAVTLYGPYSELPAAKAAPDASDPVVTTVQVSATGPGEYDTPTVKVPSTGYYAWSESITGTPEYKSWTPSSFPLTPETTLVPFTPVVTTQVQAARVGVGQVLVDTYKVATKDGQPWVGGPVKATFSVYGPYSELPAAKAAPDASDPLFDRVTIDIAKPGNGVVSGTKPVAKAGYYAWYESIPESQANKSWTPSSFPLTPETTLVPMQLTLQSEISNLEVVAGQQILDTAIVSVANGDWITGATVDATITFYGPFAQLPVKGERPPADAPVAGITTVRITGPGRTNSPSVDTTGWPDGIYVAWVTTEETEYSAASQPAEWPENSETFLLTQPASAGSGASQGGLASTGPSASLMPMGGVGVLAVLIGSALLWMMYRTSSQQSVTVATGSKHRC